MKFKFTIEGVVPNDAGYPPSEKTASRYLENMPPGFKIKKIERVKDTNKFRKALVSLYSWAPSSADLKTSFFNYAYLCSYFSQNDARELLSILARVCAEAGIDPREIEEEVLETNARQFPL